MRQVEAEPRLVQAPQKVYLYFLGRLMLIGELTKGELGGELGDERTEPTGLKRKISIGRLLVGYV